MCVPNRLCTPFSSSHRSSAKFKFELHLKSSTYVEKESEVRLARQDTATKRRYEARLTQLRGYYDRFINHYYSDEVDLLPNNKLGAYFLQRYAARDFARGKMPEHTRAYYWSISDDIGDTLDEYTQFMKQSFAALALGIEHTPNDTRHEENEDITSRMARFQSRCELMKRAEKESLEVEVNRILVRPDALFMCRICSASTRKVYAYRAAHVHWREAHSDELCWFRRISPKHGIQIMIPAGFDLWKDGAPVVSQILHAAQLPESNSRDPEVLDNYVMRGRLFCVCGDPSLPTPSKMDWGQLVSLLARRLHRPSASLYSPPSCDLQVLHVHEHMEWARLRLAGK